MTKEDLKEDYYFVKDRVDNTKNMFDSLARAKWSLSSIERLAIRCSNGETVDIKDVVRNTYELRREIDQILAGIALAQFTPPFE